MKSIGLKLWVGMMMLVVFMLVILWFFQIVFLENFYINQQIDRMDKKSQEIVQEVSTLNSLTAIGEDALIMEHLETFAYTYHLNIEILGESGEVVYQMKSNADQQSPAMFKKSLAQLTQQVLQGENVLITLEHPRFGNTYVIIGFPIHIGNNAQTNIAGVFMISAPMAPVSDTADILKQQLVYISLILLTFASAIAFVISRRLSKPILNINRAAREIAKGQWDVSIEASGQDEIGQLAQTIQEMAQDLKKTDQLRKELIGNISHELRTPLSLIRGYAETIRDVSGEKPEKRNQHLSIIIDESERLARLIDDILNLSQLEVGVIKLQQDCIDLDMVLKNVANRFENLAQNNHIGFSIKVDERLPGYGDQGRIEQVLMNLVGNAFNHTPDGGKIEIKALNQEVGIRIEVIDSGTGISQEELSSIWDRYYKAKSPLGEKSIGTGLGLAIVKNILEAHGSLFGVESTLGSGTTFWFLLKKCQ